ncbi:MAG: hypothetical protein H8D42_05270 [Candidatus Marinimicrobia bacterium]|nr:hypothetical protein [Candidatus Neomarinimicrobiota bacterium]
MGHTKLSVTIPEPTYRQIKMLAEENDIKLSHLVAEALAEKARKMSEEALIQRINDAFEDPEIAKEQKHLAETIAQNTDVEEMPW